MKRFRRNETNLEKYKKMKIRKRISQILLDSCYVLNYSDGFNNGILLTLRFTDTITSSTYDRLLRLVEKVENKKKIISLRKLYI